MSNICDFCGGRVNSTANSNVYMCKTTEYSTDDDEYSMLHKECIASVFRNLPVGFFEPFPVLRTLIVLVYDFECETLHIEKFTVDPHCRKHGMYMSWFGGKGLHYEDIICSKRTIGCELELSCMYVAGVLHGPCTHFREGLTAETVKYLNGSVVARCC